MFTKAEKDFIIKIARNAVEAAVKNLIVPNIETNFESLKKLAGAFVTIYKFGELRGCIGSVENNKPLFETVQIASYNAAKNDPRFNPINEEELEDIALEISVLSPLKEIKDITEIEVGTHGILIEQDDQRGILLPQVASEYSWDRETFLNQTARKAGLPYDAWKKGKAKIFIFTAEIISE